MLQARLRALKNVYGDVEVEEEPPKISQRYFSFPRPISEPPTPNLSRATTPSHSDDEENEKDEANLSHDSEEEEKELAEALTKKLETTKQGYPKRK